MKIAFGVEYNGSRYAGWQLQSHSPSVQESLEKALSFVANQPIKTHCAGRTDSGVHACGQVVHIETEVERSERSWLLGTNVNSPEDISINWVRFVSDDFHARFSATARRYRYVILNRTSQSALLTGRVTWENRSLDVDRMSAAAVFLQGKHDFSSYRATLCQAKSPIRTIHSLTVQRLGDQIILDIHANAFLHHMVRNIAGVLMEIGMGRRSPDWAKQVLDYRDRKLGGVTAPPYGLYLMKVDYPPEFSIPDSPESFITAT